MKPLANRAIKVVEEGDIKLLPDRWTKVYMHWMTNIRDWCISRQIWWGHRIPAFYCEQCNEMLVAIEMPNQCPKCSSISFIQDNDVLDTWFSSWLWPFSTMGWPKKTADLDYFLPTTLLVTAPEIIYLWVARMIMATLEFQDKIPFDTVLLHGIVRDKQGRKLSKSLGNSPDPIDLINSVGADALRFSTIYNTPRGQDSYYSDEILETGRNFCNKIWNAFRFIMMNIVVGENHSLYPNTLPLTPSEWGNNVADENQSSYPNTRPLAPFERGNIAVQDLADKWIYSRLNQVIKEVNECYQSLRYNEAAHLLMHFVWDEFCSWYIEMAKERLYNEATTETKQFVSMILLDVMQMSMRLLHPIMPFISEEIWQLIKNYEAGVRNKESGKNNQLCPEEALIIASFPIADETLIDMTINDSMSFIQETIVSIRNMRKQINISPAINVDIHLSLENNHQILLFDDYKGYICKLAKVDNITMGVDIPKPKSSMVAIARDIKIYIPLSGLIDVNAEVAKLTKQKDKLEIEISVIQSKLKNEKFITNAKPDVIEKEKAKEEEVFAKLKNINDVLSDLLR
jgi:valyl-tRNA synthetase